MNRDKYLDRVRGLPCVVCLHKLGQKTYGCEAHHVESIRDGHSDYAVASLCREHHQGPTGVHGMSRRSFETLWKLSAVDLIALTIREYTKEYG